MQLVHTTCALDIGNTPHGLVTATTATKVDVTPALLLPDAAARDTTTTLQRITKLTVVEVGVTPRHGSVCVAH